MVEIKTPSQEDTDNLFDWIKLVPKIPIDERGVTHTGKCRCGGTISAVRSTYNGHLRASCDKCGMGIIQ